MKKTIFQPAFLIIFLLNFLFFTSHASLNLLPPYLSDLGASKGFIGFFMNVNSLTLVLFVIFFSSKIGRINIKHILLSGFILQLISLIAMYFFPGDLLMLLFFRSMASFSYAFGFTLNSLLAFEILPKGSRVSGIAFYGISGVIANPAGSYLGELALKFHHPRYLFLLGALFCIASIIIVPFIHEQKRSEGHNRTFFSVLRQKELIILMAASIILGGAWSTLSTFIPNLSKERLGIANISSYFISLSVIAILSRFFFSGFIDRLSKKILIIFSLSLMAVAMAFTASLFSFWQLYITGIIYGIAHSILYPVLNTAYVESGGENDKLIMNNSFLAFYTFGNVGISSLLGIIGDYFGTMAIFIGMAILAASVIPAVKIFLKERALQDLID